MQYDQNAPGEKQLVELFQRLVPGCEQQWVGADPDEIDEYEYHVGQPLPEFYRWFLLTMGRSMGPLTHPRLDTRIETLLSIYRSGYQARRASNTAMMVVARDPNEVMPAHYHCDLSRPIRNDAHLCRSPPRGSHLQDVSDTFREFLARLIFGRHMLNGREQLCSGDFSHSGRRPLDEVEPVLRDLGFETYHRTGPRCGLYAREDVALKCNIVPTEDPQPYIFFTFGGKELSIRHVLGQIGTKTTVQAKVDRWDPPLSV
jgi:hypothetical protein